MKSLNNEQGSVLILVLAIIAVASLVALGLSKASVAKLTLARQVADDAQALAAAKAGLTLAEAALEADDPGFDAETDIWARKVPPFKVGAGEVTVTIEDERAKLSVNQLIDDFGNLNGKVKAQFERLFLNLKLNLDLLEPIIDWLDSDEQALYFGAESDYYQSLSPAYPAKNGPLDTLPEMLLIKGIDAHTFLADSTGLCRYLTLYGSSRININTAPARVLASLSDELDDLTIRKILEYRTRTPFTQISQLKQIDGLSDETYQEIDGSITVNSEYFTIKSRGRCATATKSITAVVHRVANELKFLYWTVD
ncbi:MAG: type II secretion system minor pseudopilin GspK [bacterium]